jgi:glycosyltransferase involved in cell wall biosynthesis/Tfp pilus assembly protein PilF
MPSRPVAGEIRRDLMELCSRGEVLAAFLRLSESGLDASTHPGLWELLGRQADLAGDTAVAMRVRRELLSAGIAGPETALHEARSAIEAGDPDQARLWIETEFGPEPEYSEARLLLGIAIAPEDPNRARSLLKDAGQAAEADLFRAIDTLREAGELREARRLCEDALARFPGNPMLANRLGWIAEGMGDIATAQTVAMDALSGDAANKAQALNRLVRLARRVGDEDTARRHAAELLSLDTGVLHKLRLARTLGQTRLIETIVSGMPQDVATGRLDEAEAGKIAQFLLDEGLIGLVLYLWRRGVPIGRQEQASLERNGLGHDGKRGQPQSFEKARAMRSPDVLFPITAESARQARPDGPRPRLRDTDCVLLVNPVLAAGGAERQFLMAVRSLLAAGLPPHRIHAALFSLERDRGHDHFAHSLLETGIHLHDLSRRPQSRLDLPDRERRMLALFPARLRNDTTALLDLARRLEPAVIHGWQDRGSLAAGLVGQLLGIGRTVLSVRNMRPRKRGEEADWIAHSVYSELLPSPGVTITANAAEGARDYEDWLGLPEGRVGVLSNAVDDTMFRARPGENTRNGPIRILGVFRLSANKRPLLWLETVSALRLRHGLSLQPRLVGAGPMSDEIRRKADTLGLDDLRIDPPVPDPSDIYRESDVLLLMSRVEGTPNVVLEAQACGLPVAACRVGGVRDAMHLTGASGGLLLDAEVSATAAADAIADWLPGALQAPAAPRVTFIKDAFSMSALGRNLLALYGAGA